MSDWIKDTLYDNGVMKNKQNIKNQQKLEDLEYLQSSRRAFVFLISKPKITNIRDLKKYIKLCLVNYMIGQVNIVRVIFKKMAMNFLTIHVLVMQRKISMILSTGNLNKQA